MDKKGHKNWPDCWAERTVANISMSAQEPVVGGAPWGPILGLVLCDTFVSDLTDGRGCTFSKVTLNYEAGGYAGGQGGHLEQPQQGGRV